MKARYVPFAAKLRRYRHLARQVDRMLKAGTYGLLDPGSQKKLLLKLRERLKAVGSLLPKHRLKEALAGITLLLGSALAQPLEAQIFAPPVISPFGISPGSTFGYPAFVDIDGEGDLDLFFASGEFKFFENLGTPTAPVFNTNIPLTNPFGILTLDDCTTAAFADFDNDGDLDIMAGTFYSGFVYYENIGSATAPAFAPSQSNPFGLIPGVLVDFMTAADLDGDGDLDLLSGGIYGSLAYYENTGSPESPSFNLPVPSPFGLASPALITVPHLTDLDGDGDYDLLFMGYFPYVGSDIYFAENIGSADAPAFAPPLLSPFNITAEGLQIAIPTTADIDGDGDLDVFINDYYGNIIYFYENKTIDVQMPPSAANSTVTTDEDVPYFFSAADFNFFDPNPGDMLAAVDIVGLPATGELRLNGVPLLAPPVIDASEIPSLSFHPLPDEFGSPYTTFEFRVSDGIDWSVDAYLMTINVQPVNDAPTSQDALIELMANTPHVFAASDFPFDDVDGDALHSVRITSLPDKGSLQLAGAGATAGQVVPVAQLDQLTFTPGLDEFGSPYTTFEFEVSDGQAFAADPSVMTINVAPPSAGRESLLDVQATLSPNPASDHLQLRVDAQRVLPTLTVAFFDETGRLASSAVFAEQGPAFQLTFDISGFAPGLYWVKMVSGGKWRTLRFVKP